MSNNFNNLYTNYPSQYSNYTLPTAPPLQDVIYIGNTKQINNRSMFIGKVFSIVGLELLYTTIVSAFFMYFKNTQNFIIEHIGLYYMIVIMTFVFLLILLCIKPKPPMNYFILFLFTTCMSFLVGFTCSFYQARSCFYAFMLTCGLTLALAMYAIKTKSDFTTSGDLLASCLCLFILGGIFSTFVCIGDDSGCNGLNICIAFIGAIIFCAYIVYDIQLIIGGRNKQYSDDEYIEASIALYLDIINLFLNLLSLFGKRR